MKKRHVLSTYKITLYPESIEVEVEASSPEEAWNIAKGMTFTIGEHKIIGYDTEFVCVTNEEYDDD